MIDKQIEINEHQLPINSTLSGRHDPAMSECWTTPAGFSAMYFKFEIEFLGRKANRRSLIY